MTVIWCMVPEIWIATNRIFCHFVPFFPLLPSNKPKNQNFEKLKETPRYIIILHMYTVNDNHMMYSSWDMERHGQNFLSFWTIFCPFTSLKTWKIKVLKKWKKSLEVLSFYTSVPTIMIICYTVPEMWCVTDVIIFSFWANFCPFTPNLPKKWTLKKKKKKKPPGDIILLKYTKNHDHMVYCSWDMVCDGCNYFSFWAIFCPFTPLTAKKKSKFQKKWKKCLDISSFCTNVPKIMIRWCTVPEIWCVTDRRTDRWKK